MQEREHEGRQAVGDQAAVEGHPAGLGRLHPVGKLRQGLFPLNRRELLGAAPVLAHGVLQPIGVIEHLQPGLPARAESAVVQWVLRIALDLVRPPVADAHEDAAAGRALAAGAGVPDILAGQRFLGRNDVGLQDSGFWRLIVQPLTATAVPARPPNWRNFLRLMRLVIECFSVGGFALVNW